MPNATAVRLRVKQDRDGFAARYQRARQIGCDTLADQMIMISDSRDDWIACRTVDGKTYYILARDRIRRRRLRVKARYWLLSRMLRHVGKQDDALKII